MDTKWKRILPEDVYVTIFDRKATDAEVWQGLPRDFDGNRPTGSRFMDIYAYLIRHYRRRINGFYANMMGISEREFCEGVHALSGISASEWRNRYMMLIAKELLTKTDWQMTKIGEYIDYSELTVFSRMFRRYTKMHPLEYRYKYK